MSIETNVTPCPNDSENPCSGILHSITPRQQSLGQLTVRRALPAQHCKSIGPWVFFDHMGPVEFEPGTGIDVRPHPHIGLATVTYLFEGEIFHRDSLGYEEAISPGDVNLMVAGKGIVHSERETSATRQSKHVLNGLQLWLALPNEHEDCEPAFYHYSASDIPKNTTDNGTVRVIIGEFNGLVSPVKTHSETLYLEVRLNKESSFTLPECHEIAVYVVQGKVNAKSNTLEQGSLTVFEGQSQAKLTAQEDTLLAVLGGEPLGKRYLFWNFVSSDPQKIEDAKAKWQLNQFPSIPNDNLDYIPLPS